MVSKKDRDFQAFVRQVTNYDPDTGALAFKDAYVYLGVNFCWKGTVVTTSYGNLAWFMTHGRWPKNGYVIDHIDHNPLNNRLTNLQEISATENQRRRRGRKVYRNYGSGKYGYGFNIHHDRRDDRYYVRRHLSRGHGKGDLKGINKSFGGFPTLTQAKKAVAGYIEEIKMHGLDYIPPGPVGPNAA